MKTFQRTSGRLYERQDILPLVPLMKDYGGNTILQFSVKFVIVL